MIGNKKFTPESGMDYYDLHAGYEYTAVDHDGVKESSMNLIKQLFKNGKLVGTL